MKHSVRKGDIIFAVDNYLFNDADFAKLGNYVVGWNELQSNVDVIPFLVYTGDHNSNTISYKYYNSANKTVFNLECKDSYCSTFNEDGFGTIKKPCIFNMSEKTNIESRIQSLTASTTVDRLVNKPLNVKMSYKEPNSLNFTLVKGTPLT